MRRRTPAETDAAIARHVERFLDLRRRGLINGVWVDGCKLRYKEFLWSDLIFVPWRFADREIARIEAKLVPKIPPQPETEVSLPLRKAARAR